jgi:hypothetical protein
MSGAPTPPILLEPIASSAPGGNITNPMPETPPVTPNAASVQQGFPTITMQSELAGGKPPLGQDFNGLFFLVSSHTMFVECGQAYNFNATLAAKIGGYLAGTILGMADGTGFWLNLTNGNSNNPDMGGAGWVPFASYGFTTISGLTGGIVALTAQQAKYAIILLQGALTSNLVIEVPETVQEWLIINATTGAFTTAIQTAAAGTSVTVPAGGFGAPVGVYGVGDGNIYPTVSPLSVPISIPPVASTLAERDNLGNLLAVKFNGNAAAENPTIANVIVDSGDGFFKKISLLNFIAQLPAGGLVTKTVVGNETTYNVGGLLVKIGIVAQTVATNQAHAFAAAFPNACAGVVTQVADSTGVEFFAVNSASTTRNGFNQYSNNVCNVVYIAIGN